MEDVLNQQSTFEENARQFGEVIREKYSISKMIARHRTLYKQLLLEHGS